MTSRNRRPADLGHACGIQKRNVDHKFLRLGGWVEPTGGRMVGLEDCMARALADDAMIWKCCQLLCGRMRTQIRYDLRTSSFDSRSL